MKESRTDIGWLSDGTDPSSGLDGTDAPSRAVGVVAHLTFPEYGLVKSPSTGKLVAAKSLQTGSIGPSGKLVAAAVAAIDEMESTSEGITSSAVSAGIENSDVEAGIFVDQNVAASLRKD